MEPTIIIDRENTAYVESVTDENGVVQPIFRKKLIRTVDYISRLVSQLGSDCHVLPRNCRMNIPYSNGARVVVIEEAPRSRYLKFDWDFIEETRITKKTGQAQLGLESLLAGQQIPYSLRIQLPYIVFILFVQEKSDGFDIPYCRVFFRNHPLGCSGDYLGYANLFNISSGNEVCFGNNKRSYPKNKYTLSSAVEEIIALYWATPFAADYRCRHDKYNSTPPMNSFLAWSMASQKPAFGFTIPLIMHDKTLSQEIETFVASRTAATFERVFIAPVEEQVSEGSGIMTYQNLKLLKNVVSIGDKLVVRGTDGAEDIDYYIDSITGNHTAPKTVDLVNIDGEKITVELTTGLLSQWDDDITAQRTNYLSSFNVDGKTVSTGTIIRIKATNTYEIVDKIRISRDNIIEFIIGSKFFMALDGSYDVIDSVKAGDTELVTGKDYIIFNNQYRTFFKGRMIRIQNNSYNILHVFFSVSGDERGISVDSIYNGDFSIFEDNDSRVTTSRTFRFLDQLITDRDFCIVKGVGIFSVNDSSTTWNSFSRDTAMSDILSEDGTKLHIASFDVDIDFAVGDEIVYANWSDLNNLSKIWTITSFTREDGHLKIGLQCGEETLQYPYINLSSGRIKVGMIRKISRSLNGIEAGSLIQAKNPGILGFPKKAINKIVAFIIDSKQPLVLCGNGMTIKLESLITDFNIVNTTRPPEVLNLNKIAWQTGDVCIKDENLFVYNADNTYLGKLYMLVDPLFVKTGSFKSKAIVSQENHPDFQRYGILSPRLSKNRSHVIYEQIPDFVNGTTHTFSDGYYPSTILNVSEE